MAKGKSVKEMMKSGFKSRFHTEGFSMFDDIPPHLKGPELKTDDKNYQTPNATNEQTKLGQISTKSENDLVEFQPSTTVTETKLNAENEQTKLGQISTKPENDLVEFQPSTTVTETKLNAENEQTKLGQISTKPENDLVEFQPSTTVTETKLNAENEQTKLGQISTKSENDLAKIQLGEAPIQGAFLRPSEFEALPNFIKNQIFITKRGVVTHTADGYLQRPHVFRVLRVILSPSEFLLFDYFYDSAWDGDKDGTTRQSLSRLAERTTLSLTTVKQCLKSLEERTLLRTLDVNMKTGILYQVAGLTRSKNDLVEKPPSRISSRSKSESDQVLGRKTTTCKELLSKELSVNNSLSQHRGFNERWQNLPKRTREREKEVITFWTEKCPEDIEELFSVLTETEITKKDLHGNECRSPIGLIESSWPTIKAHRKKLQMEANAKSEQKERQANAANRKAKAEEAKRALEARIIEEFDQLTEVELDSYLERVYQLPKYAEKKPPKGSRLATAEIQMLMYSDAESQMEAST